MADSSDIDDAIVAKLRADTALVALMPDGIYIDEALPGKTRFVIVAVMSALDEAVFGRRGFEDVRYLVEARALSTSGGNVKAAAARIDAVLEDGTLTIPGYGLMTMHRVERVRTIEVDALESSLRWNRRGGYYRVMVTAV